MRLEPTTQKLLDLEKFRKFSKGTHFKTVTASKLQVTDQSFWYHWASNEQDFHVVIKIFRKYDHIRKLNFQVAIKNKLGIFWKFLLNLVFLCHISLLFQKNCNFSKIKFLVGLRKFFEILTSRDPPLWRTSGFATNFYGTPAAGSPPKMRLFLIVGNF